VRNELKVLLRWHLIHPMSSLSSQPGPYLMHDL